MENQKVSLFQKALSSRTSELESKIYKNKNRYDFTLSEHYLLTDIKSRLLDTPGIKWHYWCGGRGTGKTRPAIARQVGLLEKYPYVQGLILKKHIVGATTHMFEAVENVVTELQFRGFDVPDYELSGGNVVRTDKRYKNKNKLQKITTSTFDDVNKLLGLEAKNLAIYGRGLMEEVVEEKDASKNPDMSEWRKMLEMADQTVNRSNEKAFLIYEEIGKEIDETYLSRNIPWDITFNPYTSHPAVILTERYNPEDKFLNFVFGVKNWKNLLGQEFDTKTWVKLRKNMLKNHTLTKTVKKDYTYPDFPIKEPHAFTRTTKFANPLNLVPQKKGQLLKNVKAALTHNDKQELFVVLGMQAKQKPGKETYNTDLLEVVPNIDEKIKSEGWKITKHSIGWDVDVKRLFAGTVALWGEKLKSFNPINGTSEFEYKLFIKPQISFKAFGSGKFGERNFTYLDKVIKKSNESYLEYNNVKSNYLIVDDDRKMWIKDLVGKTYVSPRRMTKKGYYDIINRQDFLNKLIVNNLICIDAENKKLISDLKDSYIKSNGKRDESGTNEDKYDTINSLEGAIWPFRGIR